MIDTHCHLLPAVDDGPRSDPEALRLARSLADDGVTTVVCTPHFSSQFAVPILLARDRHSRLRRELGALGVRLETVLAAEVSVEFALEVPLARLRQRAIGGKFLLVELVRHDDGESPTEIFRRLATAEIVPIFAHPERCRAVQRDPSLLDEVRAAGALVQVVAPSLAGRGGEDIWSTAWTLLERAAVDLLASDAHRASPSGPRLGAVATLIEHRYGREARVELTETGPRRVLGSAAVVSGA